MRWEERVERMMEVYCSTIENPLERVCLKHDLFIPLAKLPEAVEELVSQNGNISDLCLKYLSKSELIEIEKECTENLVLDGRMLDAFYMAGRADVEVRKVIREKPSILRGLSTSTRYRLLQVIADEIWQNIFDVLLDNPEIRKAGRMLLQDFFVDGKNEKMPKSSEPTYKEKSS